ncbi:uncharacterized protein BDCG_03394 [Blastomyces dermatitidis ER-3]|uniref:Uncharacterized protein n=1 Tax=Ajellomyces dermatitidis (strain ER-3 / ATCC MYA-2586) TaxID=559297 RepID=A0ABP2EZX0_AJEDR|nr:uncharacterized protein BDCG_03394 [Blastomyces dermatitidis ER-3]EEQ88274.1 hypothetical protein BDCG_03394 [Blastomyces dermatitidis ER-3]
MDGEEQKRTHRKKVPEELDLEKSAGYVFSNNDSPGTTTSSQPLIDHDKLESPPFTPDSPHSGCYKLERYYGRTLAGILVPLAVTGFWVAISLDLLQERDIVAYGSEHEILIYYAWFTLAVFGLCLSQYGLAMAWGIRLSYNCSAVKSASEFKVLTRKPSLDSVYRGLAAVGKSSSFEGNGTVLALSPPPPAPSKHMGACARGRDFKVDSTPTPDKHCRPYRCALCTPYSVQWITSDLGTATLDARTSTYTDSKRSPSPPFKEAEIESPASRFGYTAAEILSEDTEVGASYIAKNLTSSRRGKVLGRRRFNPSIPGTLFVIWSFSSAILGVTYGFRCRWSETLDGYSLFHFGVDLAHEVRQGSELSSTGGIEKCTRL